MRRKSWLIAAALLTLAVQGCTERVLAPPRIDLKQHEVTELFTLIQISMNALKEVMIPHGYNVGMNLGRVAGAGIEDHLHFHIVPRWNGDTNFMPVLAETKVVSEALDKTYDHLLKSIKKISGK